MVKGKSRQNNGPCAVCGQQNSGEKFRKLTENLLAKAIKSPAAQQLTLKLNLNDQLCQLHYNNFIVYDRGIIKSQNKRKNTDLSYYPEGKRKISLSQERYEHLLNVTNTVDGLMQQLEDLGSQLNQIEKARESESTNFSEFFSDKIERITNILYKYFREKNLPVWDAKEFEELIVSHDPGVKGFFDIVFQSMNPEGKNLQTQQLLKQKVMLLFYQIAAMRNKQVSGTKTAIGLFLINSGASVTCINALANMGICSTYQTLYNKLETIVNNHQHSVQAYIYRQRNKLIIGCIDDYHNLHSTRIPTVTSKDQISHMATVLFNTSEASPIPYYTNNHLPIHNPNGVDPFILKEALWATHLISLGKSYNSVKFNWDNYYEGELMESLTIHSYDADLWERYGRKFDQTKLVDLLELPLKNTNNYIQAIQSFIELPEIVNYLRQYTIPIPADFPGQLFIRRAIVNILKSNNNVPTSNNITHLIPFLGPLHVSLNSRESVFLVFWSFFNQLYLTIFDAKKKLASKPKPWRINLLMYLANSGWKLIKHLVIARFGNTKITGYRTFFDLLDNLIPATLDIYTVLFRNNKFDEYIDTIYRLCLLRRHTTAKVSSSKSLRRDALFIDNFRNENLFATSFVPKRDYPYKKKDLDEMIKRTALFLLNFFDEIWKNDGKVEKKMEGKRTKKPYYYFTSIPTSFPFGALPLGYHFPIPPNMKKFCDKKFCKKSTSDSEGEVLICGHAYHEECFQVLGLKCEHCYKYLDKSINELTNSYNQRLHLEEAQLELDINEEMDEDNCELEETDGYKSKIGTDSELQKRILEFSNQTLSFTNSHRTLQDITNL
ncbi:uncharacterized protein OCT59_015170 [Rhizophagus irregularis]|nr:hypothetical protein OCT59_015170 [Rhizophagus irregularis]